MTSEQRLDRLERIALMLANAGARARKDVLERMRAAEEHVRAVREQGEILMDAQMRNEARFEQNEVRVSEYEARFAQNEIRFEKLAQAQIKLTESQAHTDRRLDALIDIIRQRRN